jgi:hypothetical protein
MASPSKNPSVPNKEELAAAISSVTVVRSGVSLSVPNTASINSANLQPSNHLQSWVKLKVNGKTLHFASGKETTMRRRILRTIHPDLNLNHVKKGTGAPREAMDELVKLVKEERKAAKSRADMPALQKKAFSLQERRDAQRKAEARRAAIDAIKAALKAGAKDLTLEEIVSIWRESLVANIMEK